MTSATIGNSVKSINYLTFHNCFALTSVSVGNSLLSIDESAFLNCYELKEFYCKSKTPPIVENDAFDAVPIENISLYIPAGCNAAYEGANTWKNFGNIIESASLISPVEEILLDKNSINGHIGDSHKLYATVYPNNADNPAVVWTSDNEAVASVSEDGLVTLLAEGKAVITATAVEGSGVSASCEVTVNKIAQTIEWSQEFVDIKIGEQIELTATASSGLAVSYESSNAEVAQIVEADGKVFANCLSLGEVSITASQAGNEKYLAAESIAKVLTINPILVDGITLNMTTAEGVIDETIQLSVVVSPENATNPAVIWTSDNKAVASVSEDGLVTLLAEGKAVITATAVDGSGVSASCEVTVNKIAQTIEWSQEFVDIKIGEQIELTAVASSGLAVSYKSSNAEVAQIVEADGKVFVNSLALCEVTITASQAGNEKYLAAESVAKVLTINPIIVDGITLNKTTAEGVIDETIQLSVVVSPENATNPAVVWTSDNEAVASVSENGLVTLLAEGKAVVTATAADGSGVSATCEVTVNKIAQTIEWSQEFVDIKIGEQIELTAVASSGLAVSYESSNAEVAQIVEADGKVFVNCLALGEVSITASQVGNEKFSAAESVVKTLEVSPIYVAEIVLDKTEIEGYEGETIQLSATISPNNTTNITLVWSSDNDQVATVSEDGLVTLIAVGEANITATAADGSGVSANCKVTVLKLSGIDSAGVGEASVKVVNGEIIISGVAEDVELEVYNVSGQLVYAGTERRIALTAHNVYIVKIANKLFRVSL